MAPSFDLEMVEAVVVEVLVLWTLQQDL